MNATSIGLTTTVQLAALSTGCTCLSEQRPVHTHLADSCRHFKLEHQAQLLEVFLGEFQGVQQLKGGAHAAVGLCPGSVGCLSLAKQQQGRHAVQEPSTTVTCNRTQANGSYLEHRNIAPIVEKARSTVRLASAWAVKCPGHAYVAQCSTYCG